MVWPARRVGKDSIQHTPLIPFRPESGCRCGRNLHPVEPLRDRAVDATQGNGAEREAYEYQQTSSSAARHLSQEHHAKLDTGQPGIVPFEMTKKSRYPETLGRQSAQYPPTSVRETVTFMLKSRAICSFNCSYKRLSNSRTLPHRKQATWM
jgi:hypothetical protein